MLMIFVLNICATALILFEVKPSTEPNVIDIIGADDDLSPVRLRVTDQADANIWVINPLIMDFSEIWITIQQLPMTSG